MGLRFFLGIELLGKFVFVYPAHQIVAMRFQKNCGLRNVPLTQRQGVDDYRILEPHQYLFDTFAFK